MNKADRQPMQKKTARKAEKPTASHPLPEAVTRLMTPPSESDTVKLPPPTKMEILSEATTRLLTGSSSAAPYSEASTKKLPGNTRTLPKTAGAETDSPTKEPADTVDSLNRRRTALGIRKDWLTGDILENQYRIESLIARGGMGTVHKATDLATHKTVVIKSPAADLVQNQHLKQQFTREAEEWVKLGVHPNIVRAYTVYEIDYLPRIVAEYVDGGTLHAALAEHRLSLKDCFRVAVQLCHGMDAAHKKGLAHRDLKPSNILLTSEGQAKITDFGLVKRSMDSVAPAELRARSGQHTPLHTTLIGTPEYVAPEQWNGQGGQRSDLYSFGVILFELFCHARPFDFSSLPHERQAVAYRNAHLKRQPPHPKSINGGLPDPLCKLMLDCLQKNESKRPLSFSHVERTLHDIARAWKQWQLPAPPTPLKLNHEERIDQAWGLLRLGRSCLERGDWKKAKDLLDTSLKRFLALNDPKGASVAYAAIALYYFRTENSKRCLQTIRLALRYAKLARFDQGIISAHRITALAMQRQNDTSAAVRHLNTAYALAKKLNNHFELAAILNLVGSTYWTAGKLSLAQRHYELSLKHAEICENHNMICYAYSNLGLIHYSRGKSRIALSHYQKALAISRTVGNYSSITNTYMNIGNVYRQLGMLNTARESFEKCLRMADQNQYPQYIVYAKSNIASLETTAGNYSNALRLALEALQLSLKSSNVMSHTWCFLVAAFAYLEMGNFHNAKKYFKKAALCVKKMSNHALFTSLYDGQGRMYEYLQMSEKAKYFYKKTCEIMEAGKDSPTPVQVLSDHAHFRVDAGDIAEASRLLALIKRKKGPFQAAPITVDVLTLELRLRAGQTKQADKIAAQLRRHLGKIKDTDRLITIRSSLAFAAAMAAKRNFAAERKHLLAARATAFETRFFHYAFYTTRLLIQKERDQKTAQQFANQCVHLFAVNKHDMAKTVQKHLRAMMKLPASTKAAATGS